MALIRDGIVGDTDARQKKLLETSLLNADRLSKTLDNLLDISKIQSRSLKLEKKKTDIVQIALRAIALLDSASQQKNIDIKTNFSGGIELELDPELVTIVFVNLIENAINNTSSNGKILVTIRDEGQEVVAAVCDNGIGIPSSQAHKIFERFVQIIEENESSAKGAGLGLSICKGIVEMHGGQICFESPPTTDALNPGRGTKFIFTLRKAEQNGQ
jgi:signal transduction histidine kinase